MPTRPRTLEQVASDLQTARRRVRELEQESEPSRDLLRELSYRRDSITALEAERDILRGPWVDRMRDALANGDARLERGSGPDGLGATDTRTYNGDPWAMRSGHLAQSPSDLRGRALAAIERTEAPDGGREVLAQMVERHRPEAPESTLAAQWVVATSDPAYRSAFTRLLLDPATGAAEFTPDERAAFQRAQSVKRSLQVGDGTASAGLLAPFTLDPSWQLSSAGAIDPVRELARVVTIIPREREGPIMTKSQTGRVGLQRRLRTYRCRYCNGRYDRKKPRCPTCKTLKGTRGLGRPPGSGGLSW